MDDDRGVERRGGEIVSDFWDFGTKFHIQDHVRSMIDHVCAGKV